MNGNYLRAAQLIDLDGAISRYSGPVLLIHGDEDEAVPVSCSTEAGKKYKNSKTVIIKGDDHCYNYHLDQVLDAVRGFLRSL